MLGETADGDWGLWCQGSKGLVWRGLTRDICFGDCGPWASHHQEDCSSGVTGNPGLGPNFPTVGLKLCSGAGCSSIKWEVTPTAAGVRGFGSNLGSVLGKWPQGGACAWHVTNCACSLPPRTWEQVGTTPSVHDV